MRIYLIRSSFFENFGRTLSWWTIVLLALSALTVVELTLGALRRVYFPNDLDIAQRLEKDGAIANQGVKNGGEGVNQEDQEPVSSAEDEPAEKVVISSTIDEDQTYNVSTVVPRVSVGTVRPDNSQKRWRFSSDAPRPTLTTPVGGLKRYSFDSRGRDGPSFRLSGAFGPHQPKVPVSEQDEPPR
jgi:hypothetical protein